MAQKKKESKPFNIRMELNTFERLTEFCEISGQSKTVAVERAIKMYINEFNKRWQESA